MASTRESPVPSFSSCRNCLRSLIFQATTIRMGAMAASGMLEAYGANNNRIRKTTTP
ncbi:hypothetical protein D3C81_1943190 [compost metagenome]